MVVLKFLTVILPLDKLTFNLEHERSGLSRKWEIAFASKMKSYSSSILSVKYAYSNSLGVEISNSVTGDIVFFSVAFSLVINFSSLALLVSNCVANRYNLAFSGVIGTGLAIIGSFGLVSLCGVTFVDIVGVMPFLVLGNVPLSNHSSSKLFLNLKNKYIRIKRLPDCKIKEEQAPTTRTSTNMGAPEG